MVPTHEVKIEARAQQSRFHLATIDPASTEIDLYDVDISVGEVELVTGARIHLQEGVKYALKGRNGCGKSTLLRALAERMIPGIPLSIRIVLVSQLEEELAGVIEEEALSVLEHLLDGHTERKMFLQEKNLLESALEADTATGSRLLSKVLISRKERELEIVKSIASRRSGARGKDARYDEIKGEAELEDLNNRHAAGVMNDRWVEEATGLLAETDLNLDILDSDGMEDKARNILHGLGFTDSMIDGPYSTLSGGWRSRCRLALALLIQSDVLLLDEPSNFLVGASSFPLDPHGRVLIISPCLRATWLIDISQDLEAIIWLQHHIRSLSQTVVLISHDMAFLDAVCDETIVLRGANLKYYPGTPSAMEETERKDRLGKEKQQAALDKKKEHIESSIVEGQKAAKKSGDDNKLRMVKSRSKKLNERWGLETSAKGTRFKINRDLGGYHLTMRGDIEIEAVEPDVKLKFPEAPKLKVMGDLVHMSAVALGYGSGGPVVKGVTMTLGQTDRIALVGRNGKGKSTIAKAVIGQLEPLSGKIERHQALKAGYFDQHSVESLASTGHLTPLQLFLERTTGTGVAELKAREILGRFGLSGRLASHTPIEVLSGGQRVRLALALLLQDPPNLLVLDEVTTHLDDKTINALASALKSWKGGLILVTHDRSFCNAVMGGDEDGDNNSDGPGGRVYLVKSSGLRLLSGIGEYEEMLERKLARARAQRDR